jgi:hypothetical protein
MEEAEKEIEKEKVKGSMIVSDAVMRQELGLNERRAQYL